jgi:hypothetical protein
VQNPYISRTGAVSPSNGARYADRNQTHPGMVKAGGVVTAAFASIGWGWGGNFNSIKDYQHFSASGR